MMQLRYEPDNGGKFLDVLQRFDIKCDLLLMFGVSSRITDWLTKYFIMVPL